MIKLLQGLQVDVASSFATSFLSTPPPPPPPTLGKMLMNAAFVACKPSVIFLQVAEGGHMRHLQHLHYKL